MTAAARCRASRLRNAPGTTGARRAMTGTGAARRHGRTGSPDLVRRRASGQPTGNRLGRAVTRDPRVTKGTDLVNQPPAPRPRRRKTGSPRSGNRGGSLTKRAPWRLHASVSSLRAVRRPRRRRRGASARRAIRTDRIIAPAKRTSRPARNAAATKTTRVRGSVNGTGVIGTGTTGSNREQHGLGGWWHGRLARIDRDGVSPVKA